MVDDVVGTRRRSDGQQEPRVDLIQLFSEFGQKGRVILFVLRPVCVASQPAADRVFPVNVDPVENTGCRAGTPGAGCGIIGQVPQDQLIDTIRHKRLTVFRKGGVGETTRPRPPSQYGQHFDMGVPLFELSQLVPVSLQRLVPGITNPVHTFGSGHTPLVIGPGVSHAGFGDPDYRPVVFDIDKAVVDMGYFGRINVPDKIVGINSPGGKIADDDFVVLPPRPIANPVEYQLPRLFQTSSCPRAAGTGAGL